MYPEKSVHPGGLSLETTWDQSSVLTVLWSLFYIQQLLQSDYKIHFFMKDDSLWWLVTQVERKLKSLPFPVCPTHTKAIIIPNLEICSGL